MSNEFERTTARGETADAAYDETLTGSGASDYTPDYTTGTGSSYGSGNGDSGSTTDVAKGQAKQVGQEAVQTGQHVAGVAKDQAKNVASEAGSQAKNLLGEARSQFTDQVSTQQNNLATWVRDIAKELESMVDRSGSSDAPSGAATSLARQATSRANSVASWLEDREPTDVLQEVTRFARRRPGMFLAIAAVGGLVAGRLTRGLTSDSSNDSGRADRSIGANGYGTGQSYGTAQTYPAGTPVAGTSGTWTAPDDEYLGASTTTGYATGEPPVIASTEGIAPYDQNQR
jgi:hypothetical protein